MTSIEARDAMLKRLPVVSGGITYSRISAIIYRPDDNGNVKIFVELLDKKRTQRYNNIPEGCDT